MSDVGRFEKWAVRLLLDPGWKVDITPDPELSAPACVTTQHVVREVHIRYRAGEEVRDKVACHELVHVLLSRLREAAFSVAEHLPAEQQALAMQWLSAAEEETADSITRVFLEAYAPATEEE